MSDLGRCEPSWHELRPGYRIRRVINGGWQLSAGHCRGAGPSGDPLEALQRSVAAGFTTFDCADIYTGVEELFGQLLRHHRGAGGQREDLQIHTKLVPDASKLAAISRSYVRAIVERSCRRLGIDRLDLVQFHWWDFSIPGWVEAVGWLDELRREGLVRHIGVTNFDVPSLSRLLDAGFDIVSNQVQYSLLDRRVDAVESEAGADPGEASSMVELCAENRVHLLCYGTLAGGFLSHRWLGRPDPWAAGDRGDLANRSLIKYRLIIDELLSSTAPRATPIEAKSLSAAAWQHYQELLAILGSAAERNRTAIANLAVRWVLDRPGVAAAIVGLRDPEQVGANLGVFADSSRFPAAASPAASELEAWIDACRGPCGPIYGWERQVGGRHAAIMNTELNRGISVAQPSSTS